MAESDSQFAMSFLREYLTQIISILAKILAYFLLITRLIYLKLLFTDLLIKLYEE